MKIIEKNDGQKIAYEVSGNKLTLGDDEMTLNLSRYERDDPAHIDICRDKFGFLVCGVIPGVAEKYVAQIDIPAREYNTTPIEPDPDAPEEQPAEEDGGAAENPAPGGMTEPTVKREPVPFDIEKCVLTLWAV